MDGLFHLIWNNHNTTLIHNLQRLRVKGIFCDATVVCDGKYFPVHRVVLSSCSEYFEEIFQKTPCWHPFIVLKDIELSDLESLLEFMYKGEVNILEDRLLFFIRVGETLGIKGLAVSDELSNAKSFRKTINHEGETCNKIPSKIDLPTSLSVTNGKNLQSMTELTSCSESRNAESLPENHLSIKDGSSAVSLEEKERSSVPSFMRHFRKFKVVEEVKQENERSSYDDETEAEILEKMADDDIHLEEKNFSVNAVDSYNTLESNITNNSTTEQSTKHSEDVKVENNETLNPLPVLIENSSEGRINTKAVASINEPSCSSLPIESGFLNATETFEPLNFPKNQLGIHFMSRINTEDFNSKFGRKKRSLFKCPFCSYLSVYRSQHINHLRIHTGEKPFKCKVCSFRTSDNSTLRVHMMTHTGEKPYQCSICAKCFAKKGNLKTHLRIHTGEKPYKCDICPFSTNDSSTLRRHKIVHSRNESRSLQLPSPPPSPQS